MSEDPPPDPLARLAEKIERAQSGGAPVRKAGGGPGVQQGVALGFRIGIELVAAVIVATGLGWAFDRWLGKGHWGMIVMFFLGVAAGMLNVYRAVTGMGMAVGYRRSNEDGIAGSGPTRNGWDDEEC
jgi:ATP synthase protein I